MRTTWLISDTHFNHDNIATYCQRPVDFTEKIIKRWQEVVGDEDTVIHLGDVAIGNRKAVKDILASLPGRKVLVRGNHDRQHGNDWWMENGFAFACDGLKYRRMWLTHEPSTSLADGCELNLHGHLHNIWDGFHAEGVVNVLTGEPFAPPTRLKQSWQRLFAIEYTNYYPVNFDKFVAHPEKYQSTGPKRSQIATSSN